MKLVKVLVRSILTHFDPNDKIILQKRRDRRENYFFLALNIFDLCEFQRNTEQWICSSLNYFRCIFSKTLCAGLLLCGHDRLIIKANGSLQLGDQVFLRQSSMNRNSTYIFMAKIFTECLIPFCSMRIWI